jgi:hypothetical protein
MAEFMTESRYWAQKRTSWGAIFAGTFVGLGILMTLGLFGLAIGIGTVYQVGAGFRVGPVIWWLLISVVAYYFGGWVAGRMSGSLRVQESGLHGLTAWGLSSTFAAYAFTTALGSMLSGLVGLTQNAQINVNPATAAQAQQALTQAGGVMTGLAWTGFFLFLLTGIAAYAGGLSGAARDAFPPTQAPTYRREQETVGGVRR